MTIARNARADDNQNLTLELDGGSPEFRLSFGTGFVARNGLLLTNHHVAEPWWQDEQIGGVRPIIKPWKHTFLVLPRHSLPLPRKFRRQLIFRRSKLQTLNSDRLSHGIGGNPGARRRENRDGTYEDSSDSDTLLRELQSAG